MTAQGIRLLSPLVSESVKVESLTEKEKGDMAKITIYLDDLRDATVAKLVDQLRCQFKHEIDAAVDSGIDLSVADEEIIDAYLDAHDFGHTIEY